MKQLSMLAAALAVTAGLAGAQTIRAGVFDQQSVVVAFYRSPQWAEIIKAKTAELDKKDAEAWGSTHQELAHRQLAGDAPIANILEALTPAFPDIARRAGVNLIAPDLVFADPAVRTVDVTDLLLAYLKADARTLSIVHDLQKQRHN
jgi:hypothetical protein